MSTWREAGGLQVKRNTFYGADWSRMAEHGVSTESASESPSVRFGAGALPPELSRTSWCAFFFPWLWALRFAMWRYLIAYGALVLVSWSFASGARNASGSSLPAQAAWAATEVGLISFATWLGVNGNRIAWKAVAARGSDVGMGGLTASREAGWQWLYLAAGLLAQGYGVYSLLVRAAYLGWAVPVFVGAEVLALSVGCYFYFGRRRAGTAA